MVFTLAYCVDAVVRMSVCSHYCSDTMLLNSILMAACRGYLFVVGGNMTEICAFLSLVPRCQTFPVIMYHKITPLFSLFWPINDYVDRKRPSSFKTIC